MKKTGSRYLDFMVVAAVFLSVISQLPVFVEAGVTQLFSIPPWILVLIYAIYLNNGHMIFNKVFDMLVLAAVFFAYWGFMALFDYRYVRSAIPYNVAISMFMLLTGCQLGMCISNKTIDKMFLAYIYGSVIFGIAVYFQYFYGTSTEGGIYEYDEKNSSGIIILTALTFLIFKGFQGLKTKFVLAFRFGFFALFLFLILIMKSRAAYFSLLIVFAVVIADKKVNKKIKTAIFLFAAAFAIYMLVNQSFSEEIINSYVLANRKSGNLEDISSGRMHEWTEFFSDMGSGWLFGHGRMKRESLILTALLEFGIPVGTVLLVLAVKPILKTWRFLKSGTSNSQIVFSLALSYGANMLFEQLAPFGPGVKCFMLWLFLGMFLSNKDLLFNSRKNGEQHG